MKNIAYGQMVPAFVAGDMDAFFAFEPHCTRAIATVKGSHILNRSGQDDVVLARAYVVVDEKVYGDRALGITLVKALKEAGNWTTTNVDKAAGYMTVFRCKLGHELSDRRLRGRELPEIPHLAATAAIGNCYCITRF